MMKLLLVLCMVSVAIAQQCEDGYWGEGCVNYCGYCYTTGGAVQPGDLNRVCDSTTGACVEGCQAGYTGENCDHAICSDCSNGVCVAPELCQMCKDISHVSPNCINIKLRGLLGSLISVIVLICALVSCTLGSMFYQRKKNASVRL